MAMTETERLAFLAKHNLDEPAAPKAVAAKVAFPADAHTMAVNTIEFVPAWLDDYADLKPGAPECKAAYDVLFAAFRSPTKDADRHAALHRRITDFMREVRRSRQPGTPVTDQIKAEAPMRELAKFLAANNITAADVAAALGIK